MAAPVVAVAVAGGVTVFTGLVGAVVLGTTNLGGIALVITSVAGLVASITAAVIAVLTFLRTGAVKAAVATNNGRTIGEMTQHTFSMTALDVDPKQRTHEENEVVDMLTERDHVAAEERRVAAQLIVDTAAALAAKTEVTTPLTDLTVAAPAPPPTPEPPPVKGPPA